MALLNLCLFPQTRPTTSRVNACTMRRCCDAVQGPLPSSLEVINLSARVVAHRAAKRLCDTEDCIHSSSAPNTGHWTFSRPDLSKSGRMLYAHIVIRKTLKRSPDLERWYAIEPDDVSRLFHDCVRQAPHNVLFKICLLFHAEDRGIGSDTALDSWTAFPEVGCRYLLPLLPAHTRPYHPVTKRKTFTVRGRYPDLRIILPP